ncbi:MAG TPA: glycosyltransferase family 2 protein [Candidatus Eisenbacteria bacterium]|nr:glycosyltransferase family 2 protein [Candidatus Eisenbacteria bacterium]
MAAEPGGLTGAAPAMTGAMGLDVDRGGAPDLTVLIPVYNEAENMEPLLEKLEADLRPLGLRAEILVVDDGSSDGTAERLRILKPRHRGMRAICFRRNYGKSAALSVGFAEARGRAIVTMDGDLQDDSAEIGPLLRKLDEGYDLVSGWKQNRQDPISKTIPSKVFNGVTSAMTHVSLHDMNCGLKIYRAEAAKSVRLRGELHRFIPVLAHWNGYRIGELPVVHHKRRHGKTKFGAARFVNGFLDLLSVMFLTTSSTRPLHVFGRMGIGVATLGFLFTIWAAWPVVLGEPLRLRPSLVLGLVFIVLGIQFLSLGFLGELIAGTRTTEPEYAIRERI